MLALLLTLGRGLSLRMGEICCPGLGGDASPKKKDILPPDLSAVNSPQYAISIPNFIQMIPLPIRFFPIRQQLIRSRPLISPPFRRLLHRQDGLVKVKRVRFKQAPARRRFLFKCLAYGFAIAAWNKLVWRPFLNFLDDSDEDEDEESQIEWETEQKVPDREDRAEHDRDPLFIPLAMPSLVDGPRYTRDGPEWTAFVKIAEDEQWLSELQAELADIVHTILTRHPLVSDRLGQPSWINQAMLNPIFPTTAPPEYRHLGFEIHDDGTVDTVTRQIPMDEGARFRDIIVPSAFVLSLVGAGQTFFKLKIAKLRSFLADNSNPAQEQHQESGSSQRASSPSSARDPGSTALSQKQSNYSASDSLKGAIPKIETSPQLRSDEKSSFKSILSTVPEPDPDFMAAADTFKQLLRNRPPNQSIPRGCFFVWGMVSIRGQKGDCIVHVNALYDPSEAVWIGCDIDINYLT
ncbi:hypothetical protein CISG_02660 [Coccidioides immitis RMSCC 3703]|uniref:Uncharacterized protein n=1 Tax=Coccidioides immitis RMSCC 3703 TaxID=454286 RepID=A0A0J8U3F8_COCIT|nr:hypothetical protein CISG_02660 [Coccidioides immitis RMSCC 3703]